MARPGSGSAARNSAMFGAMSHPLVSSLVAFVVCAGAVAGCVGDDPTEGARPKEETRDDDDIAPPANGSDAGATQDSGVIAPPGDEDDAGEPGDTDDAGDAGGGAALPLDIHVVRNPAAPAHPAFGTRVTLAGLVVTGLKTEGSGRGFFAQDPLQPRWGAIYVYVGNAPITVSTRDVVTLTGKYTTYRGLDQLAADANGVQKTATRPEALAPLDATPADLCVGCPLERELQSVYVVVKNLVAISPTSNFDFRVRTIGTGTGASELIVTSFWAQDTPPSPFPALTGAQYSEIRGYQFSSGPDDANALSKLAPPNAAALQSP